MDSTYLNVSDGTGSAVPMVVSASRTPGSPNLAVRAVGASTPQKFIATVGSVGPDGLITEASKQDFYGHMTRATANASLTTPGTATDTTGGGTVAWTSPSNLTTGVATTNNPSSTVTTHTLNATNYGFSIPTNAVITGIQIAIQGKVSQNTMANHASDALLFPQIVKSGGVTTSATHSTFSYGTSYTINTYGADGDLWGATWLPADINNAAFGAVYAANIHASGSGQCIMSVLSIAITVYYTAPASPIVVDGLLPAVSIDKGNTSNQVVVIKPNTDWGNAVADFMRGAVGVSTPTDITASTLTTGDITTVRLNLSGAKFHDGTIDPTYSYSLTGTDFSNGYAFVSFAHGFTGIPRVRGRWSGTAGVGFFPLPLLVISNEDYTGIPPSVHVEIQSVDATNINVAISWSDTLGLSVMLANSAMVFQFYCTAFAAVL